MIVIAGVMLTASSPSANTINCKLVRKYLSLPGRTVQYVAETMAISEDEVKMCENGADALAREAEAERQRKLAAEQAAAEATEAQRRAAAEAQRVREAAAQQRRAEKPEGRRAAVNAQAGAFCTLVVGAANGGRAGSPCEYKSEDAVRSYASNLRMFAGDCSTKPKTSGTGAAVICKKEDGTLSVWGCFATASECQTERTEALK